MEDTIYNFKYKKIKNFLNVDEIEILKNYTIINHRKNDNLVGDYQSDDSSYYADPAMEGLLLAKRKKMELLTGLKLLPTYAYYRLYTYLADLKKHKDRPACEISVTINLGSSGEEWPIFMDGNPIELEPGDAAIYLGCEIEHWREEFYGDYCSQAFLHYVNFNGEHKAEYKDRRQLWGTENVN